MRGSEGDENWKGRFRWREQGHVQNYSDHIILAPDICLPYIAAFLIEKTIRNLLADEIRSQNAYVFNKNRSR